MLLDVGSLMFDLLKPEAGSKTPGSPRTGRQDNHKLLFSLVMFEQWLRGIRSDQKEAAITANRAKV